VLFNGRLNNNRTQVDKYQNKPHPNRYKKAEISGDLSFIPIYRFYRKGKGGIIIYELPTLE